MSVTRDNLADRRSQLAARKAALSAVKRQELDGLLKKFTADGVERLPEQARLRPWPRPVDGYLPLSYAQQRLWFLDQLMPGSNAYNLPASIYLDDEIRIDALAQALGEVLRRHEALRTTFVFAGGEPKQVIQSARAINLPVVDLSRLSKEEQESIAERLRQEDALRSFDLASGPLLRPTLVRLNPRRHLLLASMHHIVSDGWSMEVLFNEMQVLYQSFSLGGPSPLPELEFQYADYAQWQREWAQGDVLQRQLEYWKQQLAGAPTVLNLGTASGSFAPPRQSEYCALVFPEDLTRALGEFSRTEGVSLFMTLITGLHTLLHRCSGQQDVLIGTPVAGRSRAELEPLIGFFVNMVVLRSNFEENPSFRQLLRQVREAALGAYGNQDVPFEKLVEELKPERSAGRNPIFQAVFTLQNLEPGRMEMSQVNAVAGMALPADTKFDLEVYLRDTPAGITGSFVYSPELFEPAAIARMVDHFQTLFAKAMAQPDVRLSELSLLGEIEYRQVVEEWNDTTADFPEACIDEIFEGEAKRRPDAVAVEFDEENLSYRELNRRANALARRLRAAGVSPEVFVGVMLERSTELIVALLAVAKAGGVYVPLNLSDPASRTRFILDDAGIEILVTTETIASHMPETELKVVRVDIDRSEEVAHENISGHATADNLAYMMYTSGSTGTPKGVCITHRNIMRLVANTNYAELNADEIFVQFAPVSFDASTFEIWGSLLNGARLVVFPPFVPSLTEFHEFFKQRQVTTTFLTTGLFNQLVDSGGLRTGVLKQVLTGGEAVSTLHIRKAIEQLNGSNLTHVYGPTETTTFATSHYVASNSSPGSVPIGRPIVNTTTYLLDRMQPVAVGERGELFIGGPGVGRGYHHRPDLTAERFVPNPFAKQPGERIYRTGDEARYLDGGAIDFLGRLDQQVKLSGFRIELGEIETVLGEHPAVASALVQAVEVSPGDKRLVAYVVSDNGSQATNDELQAFLHERLPAYMVPSLWVPLEQMPLTANGKVDRRALPAPAVTRRESFTTFVPPRTQVEEVVAAIWNQILGFERIGREDNFFDLGGHSLLATRIISRIRESFQVELPLRILFESPTVAELATRIEEAMRSGRTLELPPLTPRAVTDRLLLSYAQRRLWFLDQLIPGGNAYNIVVGFRLAGVFNPAVLEQSLGETVRRHESLRTNFININGEPIQQIDPRRTQELPLVDLTRFAAEERESLARHLAQEAAQRPFDLASDPLLRTTLFRLDAQDHVLVVVMHHIVSDGWSMDVLMRDVPKVYRAFSRGEFSPLPDLELQYADFAHWQREWLHGENLDLELDYWRGQLAGTPPELNLPIDRPWPATPSLKGGRVHLEVPEDLTQKLKALSQSEGSTLFITLLGSLQMLLARYCGQNDIPIGTPVAGRRWVETEDLIGFFVNTLVIRTRFGENPTLREALRRSREAALEAQAHQDLPFEKLVEELQPERTLSHGPLFQVMFTFQKSMKPAVEIGDLMISEFEPQHSSEKTGLTLRVVEDQRLFCTFSYSTDVFNRSTIERLGEHWQRLLEAVVADSEQLLLEVELLSKPERLQALMEWNATEMSYPLGVCVHDLFDRQVELTPDAVAVSCEGEQLSYAQLQRRANQLAHYLLRAGVEVETPVALYLERSLEMIVGLLGVLKAGGAYVPLETSHPKGRVRYMLENSGAQVVLTQQRLQSRLPEVNAKIVCLDSDWPGIAAEPETSVMQRASAENLAYIIYTSGSTGSARGVMVQHRSVINLAATLQANVYDEHQQALRVSVNAPLLFDSSVKQVVQLLFGHELCIVPEAVRRDGERLLSYLRREAVDVLDCTPSQLRLLLASGLDDGDIRLVLIGGEAIDDETWQMLAVREQTTFYNVYGPTECTVDATVARINGETAGPSLGRPLGNVQTYVLDQQRQPVAVGVRAELCIGGAGVARGYLNEPELSATRFVPDAFSGREGARLYRSGDLARQRANGEIEFLGRLDYQVKIRGHRIEPGEVEAALRKEPQVKEAVVIDREEQHGDKRLVAYIVPAENTASIGDLQRSLKENLPDYMIPTGWVVLDQIPLTPNGKVDRAALPDPGRARLDTGQSFVAPQTLIEEVLATIWKQVLRVEKVGRDDNFFWLGGHSLLATQITSRVRESFRVELPVRNIFESPTLAEFSARIETAMRLGSSLSAPPLAPLPPTDRLPLSYAQERLWLLDQLLPGSNAYNLPAEMFIDAPLNIATLEQALGEVLRRHEALRTVFTVVAGHPVQRINPPAPAKLTVIDLSHLPAEGRQAEADRLRRADALKPFDLATGPVLRANLVRLEQDKHLFLVNMHHIVSDGWSMGVLLHEMETLFTVYSNGRPSPLPELEVQYRDYSLWQRNWLQGDVLQSEVDYWKELLDGVPTLLELETDHPRPVFSALRGAHHPVAFSEEVSVWLREFSRQEGATLFMTLMAGFHALLWRYTGQDDVLVGTPIAGRSHVELEPMIGFFVNMIPIKTSFSRAPTFRELVRQVRESSFAAYTHQDLPFNKLVEEMQPKRAPGRNPIFQVILAFQNAAPEMEMAKLTLPAGVPVSADIKFDLEVHLRDTAAGIRGTFVYSPDLFEPAMIERMVNHFQRLFETAMTEPDTRLAALSLLDEAEYRQVVHEWNDTAVAFPDSICIHQLFEQQAAQHPDRIAVEFEHENVTYGQLNQRANALALRLRQNGIGPEVFVGAMLERSADLILSLLAVAKAGGVYVPLNLSDPPMRLKFILENAGVNVLVTNKQIAEKMPPHDLTLVFVDEIDGRSTSDASNIDSGVGPENLAYLMYTSGSTGTPKGVCITHRNILGLVKNDSYAELNSEEIFLQISPVSFDASTFEIWACLLNGARLVVFPQVVPSLSELGEFIARRQITTSFLTTGLFHQLADNTVTNIGALRQLLTGGDTMSPNQANKALDQMEDCRLINVYGPTETTGWVTTYAVTRHRPGVSVPIGRPISNARIYIVNATQPAGVGERGELLIGGAGVGRGYHNRPELTAERFVPDPYGPRAGDRLYRTGDAARYLSQGLIQFLGRLDNQVKISGYRIELGEIENALSTHPQVSTAVVVVREESPGDKRLIAYVVPEGETAPANDELRSYLKVRLPEYMVPAICVVLEEFPLTPHGKVDRAALPAPQIALSRSNNAYVSPQNGLQEQLVEIWEELFRVHPIGIADDFFELGGHSLMMVMLIARVEERLGKRVSMQALFREPTIQHLAELIGYGRESLFQTLLVTMQGEGTNRALFAPHAGGGHVWCYTDLAHHIGSDQPLYGVNAREPESGLVHHTQIEAMASDYVEAVRSQQAVGPYRLAGWSMGGVIAYEMARQLQQQGQQIELLVLIDSHAPTGEEVSRDWAVLMTAFALDLGLTYERLGAFMEEVSDLGQMAQLRKLWTKSRQERLVPNEMTLVEFRRIFDVFKINANTMWSYRPGPYDGRLTLFRAEQDIDQSARFEEEESKTVETLKKLGKLARRFLTRSSDNQERAPEDPLYGWGKLATGGVDVHVVPGDHFSMIREPHASALAEHLRNSMRSNNE